MIKYKRILLKLSGEAFMGSRNYGIDEAVIEDYAKQIAGLISLKVQVAIVIGGGNIFRGLKGTSLGFDRVTGDQIGMLATIINSLALKSALINAGVKATVFTSIRMEPIGTFYTKEKAVEAMTNGEIAIIAGGTGNPYFTTDTASALRAIETEAEIMLKGTRVDGIYTADPEKDTKAKKFDQISYDEVYRLNLKVMDLTAITLCKENNLPLLVFNMNKKGSLLNILKGENIGTLVK
ncbi:MAG: UMP kinase [Bacteroidales bacterium]|nr:UMP kinase [Bacteroidales bacterium]